MKFILKTLFRSDACRVFGSCMAQAQTVTGSITGTITDPSGAVVVGAQVVAQ